jgi:uncharacterized OsmC-like protein
VPDLTPEEVRAVEERETVWVERLQNVQCKVDVGHHFAFITDEPLEIGGSGTAVNPFAMVLAALGTCSVGTLTGFARANGIHLEHVTIKLTRKLNIANSTGPGDPRELKMKIKKIKREITVSGPESDEELEQLRQAVAHCPVANSLRGAIQIEDSLNLA